MDRPIGIMVICALYTLMAIAIIVWGAVLLTVLDRIGEAEVLRRMPALTSFDFVALRTAIIVMIVVGVLCIGLALALWCGSTVAWWIFMIFITYSLVRDALPALSFAQTFTGQEGTTATSTDPEITKAGIRWLISLLTFVYMLLRRPLDFFHLYGRKRLAYAAILLVVALVIRVAVPESMKHLSPVAVAGKSEAAAAPTADNPLAGLNARMSTEGWMLPNQPIHLVLSKDVPAYDLQEPSKRIGTFKAGSELEILASKETPDPNHSKYKVQYTDPTKQVIKAMCNNPDLTPDMPGNFSFSSIPQPPHKANAEEQVEMQAELEILQDPLFGGHSRGVKLDRDATAYDRNPPYKVIGKFKMGTHLEVGNTDAKSGMVAVALVENGKVVKAFCKEDQLPRTNWSVVPMRLHGL